MKRLTNVSAIWSEIQHKSYGEYTCKRSLCAFYFTSSEYCTGDTAVIAYLLRGCVNRMHHMTTLSCKISPERICSLLYKTVIRECTDASFFVGYASSNPKNYPQPKTQQQTIRTTNPPNNCTIIFLVIGFAILWCATNVIFQAVQLLYRISSQNVFVGCIWDGRWFLLLLRNVGWNVGRFLLRITRSIFADT